MITEQWNNVASSNPLIEMSWVILEAPNDLRDTATIETCRRVIDAILRGDVPAKSDIDVMFNFF